MTLEILTLWGIMRKFDVWHLARLLQHIHEHREDIRKLATDPDHRDMEMPEEIAEHHLEGIMMTAQSISKQIRLQSTNDLVWEGGGTFWAKYKAGITFQEAHYELDVLRRAIEADLERKTFAFVLPRNAEVLDHMEQDWGAVWNAIPDAKRDIEYACECYALEENTGSVFHLMRVAEWGLRAFCHHLGIKNVRKHKKRPAVGQPGLAQGAPLPMGGQVKLIPVEYSQWEDIIKELRQKATDKLNKLKRGSKKQQLQEFYNSALAEVEGFKDAWRNHVMHTRSFYGPEDTLAVMAHVKRFMTLLTSNGVTKV